MDVNARTHRDLVTWQESMNLAEMIYSATARFPVTERFGLSLQMRRAAVSIVSNISEGAARSSVREFARFLEIARGSLAELDAQLNLAARLGFLQPGSPVFLQCDRCGRLLTALTASIRNKASEA